MLNIWARVSTWISKIYHNLLGWRDTKYSPRASDEVRSPSPMQRRSSHFVRLMQQAEIQQSTETLTQETRAALMASAKWLHEAALAGDKLALRHLMHAADATRQPWLEWAVADVLEKTSPHHPHVVTHYYIRAAYTAQQDAWDEHHEGKVKANLRLAWFYLKGLFGLPQHQHFASHFYLQAALLDKTEANKIFTAPPVAAVSNEVICLQKALLRLAGQAPVIEFADDKIADEIVAAEQQLAQVVAGSPSKQRYTQALREETYWQLAQFYEERDPKKAADYFDKVPKTSVNWRDACFRSANCYLAMGDFSKAKSSFELLKEVGDVDAIKFLSVIDEWDEVKKSTQVAQRLFTDPLELNQALQQEAVKQAALAAQSTKSTSGIRFLGGVATADLENITNPYEELIFLTDKNKEVLSMLPNTYLKPMIKVPLKASPATDDEFKARLNRYQQKSIFVTQLELQLTLAESGLGITGLTPDQLEEKTCQMQGDAFWLRRVEETKRFRHLFATNKVLLAENNLAKEWVLGHQNDPTWPTYFYNDEELIAACEEFLQATETEENAKHWRDRFPARIVFSSTDKLYTGIRCLMDYYVYNDNNPGSPKQSSQPDIYRDTELFTLAKDKNLEWTVDEYNIQARDELLQQQAAELAELKRKDKEKRDKAFKAITDGIKDEFEQKYGQVERERDLEREKHRKEIELRKLESEREHEKYEKEIARQKEESEQREKELKKAIQLRDEQHKKEIARQKEEREQREKEMQLRDEQHKKEIARQKEEREQREKAMQLRDEQHKKEIARQKEEREKEFKKEMHLRDEQHKKEIARQKEEREKEFKKEMQVIDERHKKAMQIIDERHEKAMQIMQLKFEQDEKEFRKKIQREREEENKKIEEERKERKREREEARRENRKFKQESAKFEKASEDFKKLLVETVQKNNPDLLTLPSFQSILESKRESEKAAMEARDQFDKLLEETQLLRENNEELRRENAQLQNSSNELLDKEKVLQSDNDALRETNQIIQVELQAEKHKLQETDQALQAEKHKLQETGQALQAEKHKLQETDQALQAEKHKLQETDQALQAEKHKSQEANQALQAETQKLQEVNTRLQENHNAFLAVDKMLRDERYQLRDENGRLQEEYHELQAKDEVLQNDKHKLQDENGRLQENIHNLQKRCVDLESKINELTLMRESVEPLKHHEEIKRLTTIYKAELAVLQKARTFSDRMASTYFEETRRLQKANNLRPWNDNEFGLHVKPEARTNSIIDSGFQFFKKSTTLVRDTVSAAVLSLPTDRSTPEQEVTATHTNNNNDASKPAPHRLTKKKPAITRSRSLSEFFGSNKAKGKEEDALPVNASKLPEKHSVQQSTRTLPSLPKFNHSGS